MLSYLFIATNIPKIKNYFSFEQVKKKLWGKFTKNYVQKSLPITLSLSSQKYRLRTRDPEKPIGSRGKKGVGSRIRNTGYNDS